MTYVTGDGTGSLGNGETTSVTQSSEQFKGESLRIITGSAPIPDLRYAGTEESTDKPIKRINTDSNQPVRKSRPVNVATREHVSRLLRQCQQISRDLLHSEDPIESALLGGQLTNSLHELWEYRTARESDWIEILNVLQIAVPSAEFEFLPREKRLALVKIFGESLLIRTVGPTEVDRSLKILTEAGFDIWCAFSDENENK